MDARELLHGLSASTISDLCHVSLPTARRWKRRRQVPASHARLLELLIFGQLGALCSAWSGWRMREGKLITPEGWSVSPGEVRAIPYRLAQVSELERALRQPQQWALPLLSGS
jgi:hypothetical protein